MKTRRLRCRGRFRIADSELRGLYLDQDIPIPDIAKQLGVSWWTVYRRLRDLNIHKTQGARKITAPLDKTVFVLAVSPVKDADLYFALREVIRQLPFPVSLKTYDSTYRQPRTVSLMERVKALE